MRLVETVNASSFGWLSAKKKQSAETAIFSLCENTMAGLSQ